MEHLISEYAYHIFNHSNGSDLLFREEQNYLFFLGKYRKYIFPVVDTYAYCLMPNHFHVLVNIKKEDEIVCVLKGKSAMEKYNSLELTWEKENFISRFISKQFSNLFSSYTQAFNKMHDRKGSLFIKNFKRKKIEDESYFTRLINYIHLNPVTHGFVSKPEDWKYSSYNTILSDKSTLIKREAVIKMFDDVENFKYCHLEPMEI